MTEPNRPNPTKASTITTVPGDALELPRRMIADRFSFGHMFQALQHRNYRIFFVAQLFSFPGTWMQIVAEGWLVYDITNSPLALGFIRFLHTIPITLLSLLGGIAADHFRKRHILLLTQFVSMILALALFSLAVSSRIQVWHVGLLALGLGIANAFEIPARQSFIIEMVGKKELMNAIALNSSVFNAARIVGPALAGLVMTMINLAVCFLLNAISFAAGILGYLCIRIPPSASSNQKPVVKRVMSEAIQYVLTHATPRTVLTLVSTMSLFGLGYTTLMPVFARDILQAGAPGLSWMMTANGVGAFLGAVTLTGFGDIPNKWKLVRTGIFGFSLSVIAFSTSKNLLLSSLFLMLSGWFMILTFATANTLMQHHVPDHLRGRVMGIYSLCLIGFTPFGSLIAGLIAKAASAPVAVGIGGAMTFLIATTTLTRMKRLIVRGASAATGKHRLC